MKTNVIFTILAISLMLTSNSVIAQNRQRAGLSSAKAAGQQCRLAGAYRIDTAESDKLYSVVQDATSNVPFSEQQRFFMDLSLRLTPPDMLAIECSGGRVSVGSSRSSKVTFLADGRTRRERSSGGSIVNSRVVLSGDTLTFTSTGKADDNVNVAFQSIDGGSRLRVTRRIHAEQLTEPIVIQTIYDRVSETVNWNTFDESLTAGQTPTDRSRVASRAAETPDSSGSSNAAELRRALADWIAATNRKDINGQMRYYLPELKAFYLTRNTSRNAVRTEKVRVFRTARSVDIRAEEPEIVFQDGGRSAVMRFRKKYRVAGATRTQSGEVIQELRWQQTIGGWRISSERDVKVIR